MFPTKNTFSPTAVMSPEEYNKTLMQSWKMLQAGRRVSIHRSLIQITGNDIKTAAFLSQLLYWLRIGTEVEQRDGWIFKSIQQMEYETGLTKTEQRKCKDDLKKLGFIQTGFFGQGRNLAFKINIDAICKAVCAQFGVQNMSQITLEDWRKQELDFFRIYFSDSVVYHMSLVQMTGDIYIAIMLSDILYNCAKNGSETSKLFKRQRLFSTATMIEWENRTFITRTTQNRARKFLKHHGLIVEAHYLRNARIFTHPDGLLLMQLLKQRVRLPKLNQSVKAHAAAHLEMQQQSLLHQGFQAGTIARGVSCGSGCPVGDGTGPGMKGTVHVRVAAEQDTRLVHSPSMPLPGGNGSRRRLFVCWQPTAGRLMSGIDIPGGKSALACRG